MSYEDEIEVITHLLQQGHLLRLPGHSIHACRTKGRYKVSVKKTDRWFDKEKEAATFYRQETHKSKMIECMEDATKLVASWPKWKRNVLRNSVDD